MPPDHKRWFNSPARADTLLRIHCQPCGPSEPSASLLRQLNQSLTFGKRTSAKSHCSGQDKGHNGHSKKGGAAPEPVRTYHAHALILCEQSAYFDASLGELWQQQAQREPQQAATTFSTPATLDLHLDLGQEDAMDLLLRFMYDHPLPAVTPNTTPLLFQCLSLADRFDVPQCVSAVLSTLKGTTVSATLVQHVNDVPPGIIGRPDYNALLRDVKEAAWKVLSQPPTVSDSTMLSACKRYIIHEYRDVPAVIMSGQVMQEFRSLPFTAVLAWAESGELQVHSENCMVYLLSAWVQAAQQVGGQGVSAEQLEQLAQQVRVLHLGPAYQHHILPQLGWFKGCSGTAHLPMLLALKGKNEWGNPVFPADEVEFPDDFWEFPAQWVAKARQQARVTDADKVLRWEVGGEQLRQLYEGSTVDSPPLYLNGFMLRMTADTDAAADGAKTLGLFVSVDPVQAEKAIPWSDTAAVRIGTTFVKVLHGPEGEDSCMMSCFVLARTMVGMWGWGYSSMLSKHVPSASDLVSPYLKDGKLHVEANLTTVDHP